MPNSSILPSPDAMRFLLFTLYAPMCSLGEIAVGERRMGWTRPGRSAILGLAAAALGIERGDDDAHRALEEGLYYAVRTDAAGRPFIDYHTTQTPAARRGRSFETRREELDAERINTVLSSREWRSDACFTVALWGRAGGNIELDRIAAAMRRPSFALYLGRKSAPLGLPLNPELVEAANFMDALALRRPAVVAGDDDEIPGAVEAWTLSMLGGDSAAGREVAFDADVPGAPEGGRLERRRDGVGSRARWQFRDRDERVVLDRGDEG